MTMAKVKVYRYIGGRGDGLMFVPAELKFIDDKDFKFVCEMSVPQILLNELDFDERTGAYNAYYIE